MKKLSAAMLLVVLLGVGCATNDAATVKQAVSESKAQSGDEPGVLKAESVDPVSKPKTTATVKSTKTYQSKGKPVE